MCGHAIELLVWKSMGHAHHSSANPEVPLRPGSMQQGPLIRALEALRVFDALSCYEVIFKHSQTKWDKNNNIVDQILGGRVSPGPSKSTINNYCAVRVA